MDLFTKEEIEKYGFIYEPDAAKCKTIRTGPHYKCNYYEDGVFTDTTVPVLTDEWKALAAEQIKGKIPRFTHLHTIFVSEVSPMSGKGVMCQFVTVRGHGDERTDKWFKTGILEDIIPEQWRDATLYFHQLAEEFLSSTPKEGTPEYERSNKLVGIVFSVAYDLFKKYHPNQPDQKLVIAECSKFFDEHQGLYEDMKARIAQDYEREFGILCLQEFEEKNI